MIALGNVTYAPMGRFASDALAAFVEAGVAPVRRVESSDVLARVRTDIERLLKGWDDELAGALFASNVDLDESLVRRRAELDRISERHGALTADGEPEVTSPAAMRWWLAGALGGRVKVEVQLSPERAPRVQMLDVTSVPEPSQALHAIASQIADATTAGALPASVKIAEGIDRGSFERGVRMTSDLFGPCVLGPPIDGDGSGSATFGLSSDRGAVDMSLTLDRPSDALTELRFIPRPAPR